jgi:hypothetical protein
MPLCTLEVTSYWTANKSYCLLAAMNKVTSHLAKNIGCHLAVVNKVISHLAEM